MSSKWAGSNPLYRVGGNNIQPGEEFEPTETELDSFGDLIKAIESDETEDDTESAEPQEEPNYSEMDYAELRQLAVEADTDEIDGRSKKAEIIAYFEE